MATVRVEVTQEDIDRGDPRSCLRCAVALAFGPVLSDHYRAEITPASLCIWRYECGSAMVPLGEEFLLPQKAQDFIAMFDLPFGRRHAHPITFEMDLPSRYLRQPQTIEE